MVCYRRHGHNEGDDPSYTQPLMYKAIAERRSVRKLYVETLVKRGDITVDEAEQALVDFHDKLQVALDETRAARAGDDQGRQAAQAARRAAAHRDRRRARDARRDLRTSSPTTREGFTIHPKLGQAVRGAGHACTTTRARSTGRPPRRWRSARSCSKAIRSGWPARTRAAARSASGTPRSIDYETGEPWIPLDDLDGAEANFWVYDSLLSRVRGARLRVRLRHANPDALVMWEAQFGDFVNGAQIIIDQYIVAAEDKWDQQNGLVLLLPHGYEGQGPEH